MWNRRNVLGAMVALVSAGCSPKPDTPQADDFLKNFKVLMRDNTPVPDHWEQPPEHPLDITIRYSTIATVGTIQDREVVPAEKWIFYCDALDDTGKPVASSEFRRSSVYAEEFISEKLIWESPDRPKSLPKDEEWQWSYLRFEKPGRFTVRVRVFPTAFRIGHSPQIDFGPGIELWQHPIVVLPGQFPSGPRSFKTYMMSATPRDIWRKIRND